MRRICIRVRNMFIRDFQCKGVKCVKTNNGCWVGVLGVFMGSIVGYIASETLQEPQVVTQTQVVQEELSNEDLEELCKKVSPDEEKKKCS